jgi:hypothetical protein
MDVGYTYASNKGVRLSLYVVGGFEPPESLVLDRGSEPVEFFRISDRSLECGKVANVTGSCTNDQCHRAVLGKCQCGRHEFGVSIRKAVDG